MSNIHFLRPQKIAEHPVDYQKAHPEVGGIDVIIWKNDNRDEGFLVNCRDWKMAHELVDVIRRAKEVRA